MKVRYLPNGDMCLACKKVLNNCSQLPFNQYPVIGKHTDSQQKVMVVRCKEYDKAQNERD